MLSGRGNQEWMKKDTQDTRNRALEDRTDYTSEELTRFSLSSFTRPI